MTTAKTPWKGWLWRAFKFALGLIIALHLYVLALRFVPVPTTILMVQRGLQGEDVQRDWTRLSDISPYMVQAVMAGEDGRFCEHNGIDWQAIEQAMEDNADGGRRRGGSTITQQTAKNVFFWNGGGYVRKAGEAYFALLTDFIWGKSRVMEVYLNVAEWGDGIFGVEAAAQARFGKSAKSLTRQEAALLAAVLPSPNKWRLDPPTEFVSGRASTLRQRMSVIDGSQYDSCVVKSSALEKAPKAAPKPSPVAPTKTDPQPKPLEDVLSEAEKSIETARGTDISTALDPISDTEETPDMTPTNDNGPKPTPEPNNIPAPTPTDRPAPAQTPEIPQDITPDRPQKIPQEVPNPSTPTEIPNDINAPRSGGPNATF